MSGKYDTEPLAQFLTQRALEREQARVEALQSALLEKQRLRREVRYYASLQFERDNAAEIARKAEEARGRRGQAQGRGGSQARKAEAGGESQGARKRREPRPRSEAAAEASWPRPRRKPIGASAEVRGAAGRRGQAPGRSEAPRKAERQGGRDAAQGAAEEAAPRPTRLRKSKADEEARRKADESHAGSPRKKRSKATRRRDPASKRVPLPAAAGRAAVEAARRATVRSAEALGEFLKIAGELSRCQAEPAQPEARAARCRASEPTIPSGCQLAA